MAKNSSAEIIKLQPLEYIPPSRFQKVSLRSLDMDESWLQNFLKENPQLLGLSKELEFKSGERRQPKGGRLDLLFEDSGGERRYCVEVMLGELDPSHIIRTIEYWDNERSRPGAAEHIAVLIAEEVANHRYLGVISIIAKAVPIVVLQMNVFKIDNGFSISFSKILDHTEPLYFQSPDDDSSEVVNREFWERKGSDSSMAVMDQFYDLVKKCDPHARLKYNRHHIAIGPSVGNNFMWHNPRKAGYDMVRLWVHPEDRKKAETLLNSMEVDWKMNNYDDYQCTVTLENLKKDEAHWKTLIELGVTGVRK